MFGTSSKCVNGRSRHYSTQKTTVRRGERNQSGLDSHRHAVREIIRDTDKGKPSLREEEAEGEKINRGSE